MGLNSIGSRRWVGDCGKAVAFTVLGGAWAVLCAAHVGAAAERQIRGVVLAAGRPAANAVVWLEAPNAPRAAQTKKVVLDQRQLKFSPQVLAVQAGTAVLFPNNDRVFHNVFSFHHGKVFDLGLYPVGDSKVVTFDKPGLSRIFCNIHPNMAAYVFVVDSPYFAVTDESGAFALPPVPAGRYTYRAWRSASSDYLSGVWAVGDSDTPVKIEWAK
jgi:plastocyanin